MLFPVRLFSRFVLTLALCFALVGIGFAHRVPHPDEQAKLAFLMAGGSLDDLCHDGGGDGGTAKGDCPACHLPSAVLIPESVQPLVAVNLAVVLKVVAPRESRAARLVRDPGHGLRAPPLA